MRCMAFAEKAPKSAGATAKPRSWKRVSEDVFALACETLNQIIAVG
jgi:hypothetical protein